MNARTIWIDIQQLKQAWMAVGKAFQDARPECEECAHCRVSIEHAPYGEGYASYADSECTLGRYTKDDPSDCPALQAIRRQEAEEAEEGVSDSSARWADSMFMEPV